MAAFTSARLPSSSRHTTPISSVTLHWRMLVTTGNLRPSFQMSGSLMSLGGYISHRRVCCGVFWLVGADFFFLAIILIRNSQFALTSRDRRNDADFVAVFEWRLAVFE